MVARFFLTAALALALLAGVSVPTASADWSPPAGSPLATGQHPRLLLTAADIAPLRAKLASSPWKAEFQSWIAFLDTSFAATVKAEPDFAANYGFAYLTYPVPGITYLHNKSDYGAKARDLILNAPVSIPGGSDVFWGFPLAYDWVHDLLTPADRDLMTTWFKKFDALGGRMAESDEVFNSNVVYRRATKLFYGLAIYGDGTDNVWASATVSRYFDYFRGPNGATASNSAFSGTDGGGGQGFLYWDGRVILQGGTLNFIVYAEEAFRTANGISLAEHYGSSSTNVLRYQPKYLAQIEVPWAVPSSGVPDKLRHSLWKSWASSANSSIKDSVADFSSLSALTGMYASVDPDMASLALWILVNRVGPMNDNTRKQSALPYWILGRKDLAPRAPSALGLPLSAARGDGMWLLRTGWRDNDDSYVTFSAPKWSTSLYNYTNGRTGGFEVYRKGPQVIAQGYGGHDAANNRSNAGGNTLIFPDRSTTMPPVDDSWGGMRFQVSGDVGGAEKFIPGSGDDLRGPVRQWLSDGTPARDVDYIAVDLTKSYDSTTLHNGFNPARISSYVREFVYFRPATPGVDSDRLIVLDRAMTTDTRFEKEWLFHTSAEPLVNGASSVAAGPSRGPTGTDGKTTYVNAALITATNTVVDRSGTSPMSMNGKTWLTPLLPASRAVVKVGGPNTVTGLSWKGGTTVPPPAATDSHEFESPYGLQGYSNGTPPPVVDPWVGHWRIEIIPSTPALNDTFLNAVEVSDAGAAQTPVELISGIGVVGARFGNRIAMFNRNSANLLAGSFTVARAGTYRILLADLAPGGEYSVKVGSITNTKTATSGGTIYLDEALAAGTTIDARMTAAPLAPKAPEPPRGLRLLK